MDKMRKCKLDQTKKAEHRARQRLGTRHTCQSKCNTAEKDESQYVARSLMFSRIFKEVKKEYEKKDVGLPRKERRSRMIRLARRTMTMMRSQFPKTA